ncbi:molybdopterin-dependent oxidoreductase [Natrinema sp. 74]|uniref:molybdopterin oxidoreductase family protein n=1 Tax=Natrinema sp. 74 TaxID=3384159 RepID=UPI0038D4BF0D
MSDNDRIEDVWGPRTPHDAGSEWPSRVDSYLQSDAVEESDVDQWVSSVCLLCSNGCGIDIAVSDGEMVGVRGRETDRVSKGRLGPKGLYGWQGEKTDRLTEPLVRNDAGELEAVDWDTAMNTIVEHSQQLLDERGPLSHGFYTSGQLTAEEYYTLAVIGKAGLGTPHMDGNTRLCTATAASAFMESFGTDGQPASYSDIEHTDALFCFGHNVAETQTVLWARMLDRLHGDDPPALVCVDPRRTEVAEEATVHLPIRPGTNQALMNGLTQQLIEHGWINEDYVHQHTIGFDDLRAVVDEYPPDRVAEICELDAQDIRDAAELFGTAERPLSTVLQGFYQSHQATAASCGVNNLHLLRGAIGRPGAGILQMNGQPTAQNNRETGADGKLTGFRNWDNPEHVAELAELWDVERDMIPHWSSPTHAMQIFRYAEEGSIGFLWIAGTNPAVSLPELSRVRRILSGDQCFVVVNDGYRTETTELADVVLPAALWGEKTGCATNVDRTVHLAEQAVEPPGQARSDLDIWLDYADRMGFETQSGRPLPWWSTPEEAFDEWKKASEGRLCDYSGMSYDMLRDSDGVQWPCTEDDPEGTERLYTDAEFGTHPDYCETYGHDLATGATVTETEFRARNPDGRAILKAIHYTDPPGAPDSEYPFRLTTGRTVYQFHTRTKTGRAQQLHDAAPDPWAELSATDAERLDITEGDQIRVSTPRGSIEVPARVTSSRDGTVFVPFHYGGGDGTANELTLTAWDPVSKQPQFKVCGARVERVGPGREDEETQPDRSRGDPPFVGPPPETEDEEQSDTEQEAQPEAEDGEQPEAEQKAQPETENGGD